MLKRVKKTIILHYKKESAFLLVKYLVTVKNAHKTATIALVQKETNVSVVTKDTFTLKRKKNVK